MVGFFQQIFSLSFNEWWSSLYLSQSMTLNSSFSLSDLASGDHCFVSLLLLLWRVVAFVRAGGMAMTNDIDLVCKFKV